MTQVRKQRSISFRTAAKQRLSVDQAFNAEIFQALCEPVRIRLVACLTKCGRSCSVSEIAECCDVDFSVVSRHLKMLATAGILEVQKAGKSRMYRVNYESFVQFLRHLADTIDSCSPGDAENCSGGTCEGC